jgi:hypothetical protein
MAQGKKDMLEAFLSSETALSTFFFPLISKRQLSVASELKSLLSGSVLSEPGDGEKDHIEGEGRPNKPKPKGKRKSKAILKPKPQPNSSQQEETKMPSVSDVDDAISTHGTDFSSSPSSKPNTGVFLLT